MATYNDLYLDTRRRFREAGVFEPERAARERAGRLCCLLAERADTVVRVFCGIPKVIKGELP